jgi:hypothetical protein
MLRYQWVGCGGYSLGWLLPTSQVAWEERKIFIESVYGRELLAEGMLWQWRRGGWVRRN